MGKHSKFSTLDDIRTPLRLSFNDLLVYMIFGYTKLYSLEKKQAFEITNEKIRLFFSMLLVSECHKLPDRNIYWEVSPDTFA